MPIHGGADRHGRAFRQSNLVATVLLGVAGMGGDPRRLAAKVTVSLSDELKKYIDESKVYATVATIGANGQPHLTVVWLDRDGDELIYSTTVSRQQYRNVVRDPRVTVMINPPEQPFRYAEVRGTVTVAPDPERALPDTMSLKFTGLPYREFNPQSVDDTERVIIRITPTKVLGRF
ncbi:PPOX class F420-dependent oxidoreductase [Nocardia uniformis]|nr:PPOX class F420-dependent oxidoreductase [Nocardia uniformis]